MRHSSRWIIVCVGIVAVMIVVMIVVVIIEIILIGLIVGIVALLPVRLDAFKPEVVRLERAGIVYIISVEEITNFGTASAGQAGITDDSHPQVHKMIPQVGERIKG